MDTSQSDDTLVGHPLVLRVLVVAGALFGFTVLALLMSGAAHASEGAPPPARPGLLDHVGDAVHSGLAPAEPVLKPVTGAVYTVSAQVAPVVEPVVRAVEPVTQPVVRAIEPVLSALRPVTRPVLHALSPVTAPVLHALSPVTSPVRHAVAPVIAPAAESVVPAVPGRPTPPEPRADTISSPAAAVPADRAGPALAHRGHEPDIRRVAGSEIRDVPGSGGGGSPADVHGVSGAMSAAPGGQHGGEYAVTTSGLPLPGTDRAWRAPPGGPPSLYWLVCYGNDHPS